MSFEKVRRVKPFHLNIRMHILHTVLYTYFKLLTRRKLVINSFNLLILIHDSEVILYGELEVKGSREKLGLGICLHT